jgi:hypothetical protein
MTGNGREVDAESGGRFFTLRAQRYKSEWPKQSVKRATAAAGQNWSEISARVAEWGLSCHTQWVATKTPEASDARMSFVDAARVAVAGIEMTMGKCAYCGCLDSLHCWIRLDYSISNAPEAAAYRRNES